MNANRASGESHYSLPETNDAVAIDVLPADVGHHTLQDNEYHSCTSLVSTDARSWHENVLDRLRRPTHAYLKLEDPSSTSHDGKWDTIVSYLPWTLGNFAALLLIFVAGSAIIGHTLARVGSRSPDGVACMTTHTEVKPITLIAMWLGAEDRRARTFPIWLSSLTAQNVPLELIWLNMYTSDDPECLDISAYAPVDSKLVIKQECVHVDQFYSFIYHLLCTHWQCSASDARAVKQHLDVIKAADDNLVNLHVRSSTRARL